MSDHEDSAPRDADFRLARLRDEFQRSKKENTEFRERVDRLTGRFIDGDAGYDTPIRWRDTFPACRQCHGTGSLGVKSSAPTSMESLSPGLTMIPCPSCAK